jgi:class 3 adenylate cyclase
MPGVMLTAAFGFAITRHSFLGSLIVGAVYIILFVGFALATELGAELLLQAFLVTAAVGAACGGAYLLERSQRLTFTQAKTVRALHDRVDALLHQYLSPEVATSLIADPARAALGGQELEITVLFADLRGYTSFSERRSPSEVVAMLNAAFGVAVPAILDEGGTVVQFMGDAVMAIFNAPHAQADHALRAVRAAVGMQRAVEGLPASDTRPRFRVGLNTGPALVGNVGAAAIRTYSALGDTTNLAARLQTWAQEGSVVMSSSTYEAVRDAVVVRSLGSPELKGKSVPVEVFELMSMR